MIVCHCNRISANDIEEAVCCMKNRCQNADLCPRNVYEELGACPKCCNCFPLAETMIQEVAMRFMDPAKLSENPLQAAQLELVATQGLK